MSGGKATKHVNRTFRKLKRKGKKKFIKKIYRFVNIDYGY